MVQQNIIKHLILLSHNFEEADEVIKRYTNYKTDKEKIEFLSAMFDVKIIHKTDDNIHTDYVAILSSIIR